MKHSLALVTMLVFLCSCSTSILLKNRNPEEMDSDSYLAFHYSIEIVDQNTHITSCNITLKNQKSGKLFDIELPVDANIAIVKSGRKGHYLIDSLKCDNSISWDKLSKKFHAPIRVSADKISYAGTISMKIKPKRVLVVSYDTDNSYQNLSSFFDMLNKDNTGRVVSAYSKKALSRAMLSMKPDYNVTIKAKHRASLLDKIIYPDFTGCRNEEKKSNPFGFGSVTFHFSYRGNKFERISDMKGNHSHTDRFIKCVEKTMARFKPGSSAFLEYTARF